MSEQLLLVDVVVLQILVEFTPGLQWCSKRDGLGGSLSIGDCPAQEVGVGVREHVDYC